MKKHVMWVSLALWSVACVSNGTPISAAKFVKAEREAPAGSVTMSTAAVLAIPSSDLAPTTLSGFGSEGYMTSYGQEYDWGVGVSNGALFYDANATVSGGKTRIGVLHGVGVSFLMQTFENAESRTAGVLSPHVGLFVQHSLDRSSHLYGALRASYALGFGDADSSEVTLLGSLGYSMMGSREGLTWAPELFVGRRLEDEVTFVGLGLSMSAPFF
jgi:hypothetical protein